MAMEGKLGTATTNPSQLLLQRWASLGVVIGRVTGSDCPCPLVDVLREGLREHSHVLLTVYPGRRNRGSPN